MRPVIALVGPRGSGKSTLGRLVAERLGWSFVDTDAAVEARLGSPVPALFAAGREADFRQAEADAVADALADDRVVVATGGGAVAASATRARLQRVFTVWLHAPPDELLHRTVGSTRPPLTSLPPAAEMAALVEQRRPWYAACSAFALDTSQVTPDEAGAAIERAWTERALAASRADGELEGP